MGGMQPDEKPSQWMARFRHTGVNGTEKTLVTYSSTSDCIAYCLP